MSTLQRPRPRRPPRRPLRRHPLVHTALALLASVLLLLVGVSIGRALEEGPSPGGQRTDVRSLDPRGLPPAPRTVTVTVTTG